MTGFLSLPRDRCIPPSLETILVLAQDCETLRLFRDALSASGYHVVAARNYQEFETIINRQENGPDLILRCSQPDLESSNLEGRRIRCFGIPVLDFPAANHCSSDLSAEEITLRVNLALEAARPSQTIMVVGEDKSERMMISELLETAGYRVTQAGDGNQALLALENGPPDILLTDIVLPEKDGLELIKEVHKHHPKTTVIAMSGTVRADSYLCVARLLGAKVLLKKPLSVNQLMRALRETRRANT